MHIVAKFALTQLPIARFQSLLLGAQANMLHLCLTLANANSNALYNKYSKPSLCATARYEFAAIQRI